MIPPLGSGLSVCLSVCLPVCLFCLVLLGAIPELFFYGSCACPGQAACRTLPLCRSGASVLIGVFIWIDSLELEPPTSFSGRHGGGENARRTVGFKEHPPHPPAGRRSGRVPLGKIKGAHHGWWWWRTGVPVVYPLACVSRDWTFAEIRKDLLTHHLL